LFKRGGEAGKEGFSANEKKAWREIWCGFSFAVVVTDTKVADFGAEVGGISKRPNFHPFRNCRTWLCARLQGRSRLPLLQRYKQNSDSPQQTYDSIGYNAPLPPAYSPYPKTTPYYHSPPIIFPKH